MFFSSLTSVKCRWERMFFIHVCTPLTDVAHLASTGEPLTSQRMVIKILHTSFKLGAHSYCSIEKGSFPGFFKISMVMGWFKGRSPLKSYDHCCASVCPAFFITAWHYILSPYFSGLCVYECREISRWLYIMHASFNVGVMCLPLCFTNYDHRLNVCSRENELSLTY